MKKLKRICSVVLILGFLFTMIVSGKYSVEAAKGTWKHDSKGWWYSYGGSSRAKSTWIQEGGNYFYFNSWRYAR